MTHAFPRARSIKIILAVAFAALTACPTVAEVTSPQELWLVSTRGLPRCGGVELDAETLDFQRMDDGGHWVAGDAAAFYSADDPAVPTVFFVHGNRVDRCAAIDEGWRLFRAVRDAAGERPLRVVIWSWPADQIPGLRNDAQVKASRSDVQAYYLAQCLERMSPKVPVNLVGHSFGGRVILGAVHLLGGGELAGNALASKDNRAARTIRAVVAAAAMDNASLLPERRNGLALGQLERLLLTCNSHDPVLKWYPLMYGRGGPEALGYTGPACPSRLGNQRDKIETLNVSCSVGKSHDWVHYLGSRAFRDGLVSYTLEP